MHKLFHLVLVILCVAALAAPGWGQVCGDANDDGKTSISDILTMMVVMGHDPGLPYDSANADCDDRLGLTISDATVVAAHMFWESDLRDCIIQNVYSFAPSSEDTIFVPMITSIPSYITSVSLPIVTSFSGNSYGFYLPLIFDQGAGPGLFTVSDCEGVSGRPFTPYADFADGWDGDTLVVNAFALNPTGLSAEGRDTIAFIHFSRSTPGEAQILPELVERSARWKTSVAKDGDLYTPVIVYYEVALPVVAATVEPINFALAAMAGKWSFDDVEVAFTSVTAPVSFELQVSDPWIVIDDFQSGGYTTPATITVRADATELTVGDYSGQITIVNPVPAEAEFNSLVVDVNLHVGDPLAFPWGDLNCDGQITIGDISLLIDCLFITLTPISPCP